LAANKELLIISFGRIISTLIALISIRAVTSFLPPEKYGELAILVTIQMLCGLFLINPVGQHINLHTHAWWDDKSILPRLKSFRSYVIAASFFGAAITLSVLDFSSVTATLLAMTAVFFMVVAGTWNATLIPMLNMIGFRGHSVFWAIVTSSTGLIASLLLVTIWASSVAWFTGQAIGMIVGAMGARNQLKKQFSVDIQKKPSAPLLSKDIILGYCLPLSLAAGLMWIQLSGYRFAIQFYWGLTQLGFIAIGLQLAGQIWALVESLAIQFLNPFFFRRVSGQSENEEIELAVSDLLNTLVPSYLLIAGLTIVTAPYLLKLLVAPEYSDAWYFVAVGALVELCRAVGNVLGNAAHVKRKTLSLATPYAVGAFVILGCLAYSGSHHLDIKLAAAGLMAGAVAMLITMIAKMHKQVRFKLDRWRCMTSFMCMLGMASIAAYAPAASSWTTAIGYITMAFALVAILVFIMLWKNPATSRLLSVQLRKI